MKQASTLKYIGVWLLAFVPGNFGITFLGEIVAERLVNNISDYHIFAILGTPIFAIILTRYLIFIYESFSDIEKGKVAPWVYVLTAFAHLRDVGIMMRELSALEASIIPTLIGGISSYLIICLWYRQHFIKTDEWLFVGTSNIKKPISTSGYDYKSDLYKTDNKKESTKVFETVDVTAKETVSDPQISKSNQKTAEGFKVIKKIKD